MVVMDKIKRLCTPAYVYLVISAIGYVILIFQNSQNTNAYCVGDYECQVPNTALVFIVKAIYVIFWTFVLDSICKGGGKNGKNISWFLVLIPFILMAIAIALLFANNDDSYSGFY